MLINTITQQRIWEADFKKLHPNTSFPEEFTDEMLESFGSEYRVIHYPPYPGAAEYENVVDIGCGPLDGKWTVIYQCVPKTPDEVLGVAVKVRAQRNALLAASDWSQLPDATGDKTAWADYRQALRNVTEQESFPFHINWPVTP
jgi:hypothetical protein